MSATRKHNSSAVDIISTRYLTVLEVLEWTGWSVWTLHRKWKEGRFPPQDPDTRGFRADWCAEFREGRRDWNAELRKVRSIPSRAPKVTPLQRAAAGAK